MDQDNRNKPNCKYCEYKNFSHIAKKYNRDLMLAVCKECYEKLDDKNKKEYISQKEFKKYQEEELQKSQPFIYEIFKQKEYDYNLIPTKDKMLQECIQKLTDITQMLTQVEEGNLEKIFQVLLQIQKFQEIDYFDLLITLHFGKPLNALERVDIKKFQNQQYEFFTNGFDQYIRKQLLSSLLNEIIKEISQLILNCIDFPFFLSIVGDKLNNPLEEGFKIQNYYGFLDSQKNGLGCWNQKNELYYGIFYQDNFLWGIKIIIHSNCQYSLYKGFFSKTQEQYKACFFINGMGKMNSKDQNETSHEYSGKFLNEKRHGEGTYTWKSKDNKEAKYTGSWQNDLYHGQGTLELSEQKITLKGEFSNGVPVLDKCKISGKDIPQQDLSEYIAKSEKPTEQNQQPQTHFGIPQNQNKNQAFLPFNKTPSFQQPQIIQFQIGGVNQFQLQKQNEPLAQGNMLKK